MEGGREGKGGRKGRKKRREKKGREERLSSLTIKNSLKSKLYPLELYPTWDK